MTLGIEKIRQNLSSEPETIYGKISMITSKSGKYSQNPVLLVSFEDGETRSVSTDLFEIKDCSVGDTVALHKRGLDIRLAPAACSLDSR